MSNVIDIVPLLQQRAAHEHKIREDARLDERLLLLALENDTMLTEEAFAQLTNLGD